MVYPPVQNIDSIPRYTQNHYYPPIPEDGLKFDCVFNNNDQKGILACSGSFNIDSQDYHFAFDKQETTENNSEIVAVVPVTLLLLPDEGGQLIQYNWNVSVYENIKNSSMQKLQGFFAVDVLDINKTMTNDIYMAYICIDGTVYGPMEVFIQ